MPETGATGQGRKDEQPAVFEFVDDAFGQFASLLGMPGQSNRCALPQRSTRQPPHAGVRLCTAPVMDVFRLREKVTHDYSRYMRSFIEIRDTAVADS